MFIDLLTTVAYIGALVQKWVHLKFKTNKVFNISLDFATVLIIVQHEFKINCLTFFQLKNFFHDKVIILQQFKCGYCFSILLMHRIY